MTARPYDFLWHIAIVGILSGCSMNPVYTKPTAPIPGAWPQGPACQNATSNEQSGADIPWREFVRDKKLQQVITLALENSRDLRLAVLNVERARALYGIQRAELLPTIQASAGGAKQKTSNAVTPPDQARATERYEVNLGTVAWEMDLFGRIRSLKERALQEYLATEEARRGVQIALISSIASAYLALAADLDNLNLGKATLTTQEATYALIKKRYGAGIATEMDLHQAQTQMDAARRDVARYTQLAAQDRNALDLLAGAPVPEERLPTSLEDVAPLADLSPGLSSEVLLRRPDILAAEAQLRVSHALLGAARAAFFPRISLTATLGTASDELDGLFGANTGTWLFAPQFVMPIFDSHTWGAYRVSKATREIAIAKYEQAIQNAFRDVADALAVQSAVDEQITAQASIVRSLETVHGLAEKLYEHGVTDYLDVLDAQRALYVAQQILNNLRLARMANQVRLYAALGGGAAKESPR